MPGIILGSGKTASEENRQKSLPMRSLSFSGVRQKLNDKCIVHLIVTSAIKSKSEHCIGRLRGCRFLENGQGKPH